MLRSLLALATASSASVACKQEPPANHDEVPPALAEYARKRAAAAANAPTIDKLPFCATDPAVEPLAALCRLGQPAERAHFECAKPTFLGTCRSMSMWACRHDALPAIRLEAFLDHTGPPLKDGEAVDTSTIAFTGPVRAVKVHIKEVDQAKRDALAKSIRERFAGLGCADGDCSGFKVKAKSTEYNDEMTVHAWLDGYNCP